MICTAAFRCCTAGAMSEEPRPWQLTAGALSVENTPLQERSSILLTRPMIWIPRSHFDQHHRGKAIR